MAKQSYVKSPTTKKISLPKILKTDQFKKADTKKEISLIDNLTKQGSDFNKTDRDTMKKLYDKKSNQ